MRPQTFDGWCNYTVSCADWGEQKSFLIQRKNMAPEGV